MIFGTLFAFGLVGLIVGIIADLMYVVVDPRIDFEGAADGGFENVADQSTPLAELPRNRQAYWSLIFLVMFILSLFAVHRERKTDPGELSRRLSHADLQLLLRS